MSPAARAFNTLGTNRARNVILLLFLVYALAIGMLVAGYAKVSSCLSAYANRSAVSTNARADAASEDRKLDLAENDLQDSDRKANRDFSRALSAVLRSFNDAKTEQKAAYEDLLKVDAETSETLDENATRRAQIKVQRQAIENQRVSNPVPPPPSESC